MPKAITLPPLAPDAVELLARTLKVRSLQLKDLARERPSLVAGSLDTAGRLDALAYVLERALTHAHTPR